MKQIQTVKCTHVDAQVSLGYYDADGNLVGEEVFPQSQGNLIVARLFHPHTEQLTSLIEQCIKQAWEQIQGDAQADGPRPAQEGVHDFPEDSQRGAEQVQASGDGHVER